MALNAFWAGKRVLITGHTGFKGSWLTLWLRMLGAEVRGFSDQVPTNPSAWELMSLNGEVVTRWGDVRDLPAVESALAEADPDVLIHMAAQPFVRRSYAEPLETVSTNVLGTANILHAARRAPSLRVIVNVTSDKCYENDPARMPLTEDMPMGGADPYSASKGCAELIAAAFARSFYASPDTAALVSVRAGNVVGGGDWGEDRLVPDLMRAAANGTSVHLRSPLATRPWQHVINPLDGYLLLAERVWDDPSLVGGWNFGPSMDQIATVLDVATGVQRRWGSDQPLFQVGPATDAVGGRLEEASTLSIDSQKAHRHLGWMPKWDLEATLDHTTNWYREALAGSDMREITARQINSYITTSTPRVSA